MPVTTPCYCSREDAQRSLDFAETTISGAQMDRAIQSASRNIEGHLHRVFYPIDTIYKWDWPNYQYADPWELWFGPWDLVTATQVESPHGTIMPINAFFFLPYNRKPGWPFTHVQIDRSQSVFWNPGPTPQQSIWITGTWGFTADNDPVTTLAAAVTTTTGTSVSVADGSQTGPGDLLIVDTERMLVSARIMVDTTIAFAGAFTANPADNLLQVPDGTKFTPGEIIALDAERMLIVDITANNLILKRGWDATILAAHTGGTIWAGRQLTVARGQLGSTAATHSNAAPVNKHRVPSLIRDLAVAEATNRVLQETSGYSRTVGSPDMAMPAPGTALADLWAEARTVYGRQARVGAV